MAKKTETENTEVELELPGIAVEELPVDPPSDDPVEKEDPAAEIAALKKQLEESNRRTVDAEARARHSEGETLSASEKLVNEVDKRFAAQEQSVSTRIESSKAGLVAAKQQYTAALTEARYEDAATIQLQMVDFTTELKAAQWEQGQVKAAKDRFAEDAKTRVAEVSQDPVEGFLKRIPGEPSKRWLRAHPEILSKVATSPNGPDAKRLFGAAQIAEADHLVDSPEYFEAIEERLGLKEPEPTVTIEKEPKAPAKIAGKTSSAAPGSRTSQTTQQTRTLKLDDVIAKLSANDVANARVSFPGMAEEEAVKLYAQGLVLSKQREPGFRPDIRFH